MNVWARAASAAVGVGLASALVFALEAVHHTWFGGGLLGPDWINGLAASASGAALLLSWLERAPGPRRRRLPRPAVTAFATLLGLLSLDVYIAVGDVQFP